MEILPFTGYYITMLGIAIILDAICPFLKIYWHFAFSIKQIINNYQFWRIFTNFLVKPTKRFDMGIVFDIIYLYSHVYQLEKDAKYSRKYSNFIMTLILLCSLNVILTFLLYFIFEAKESRSLIKEIIYSFMAISSYKNPNDKTIVFYIPVRNKYVPLATMFFSVTTSGSGELEVFRKPIIGFISGYAYCLLIEKLNINITPKFLKKLLKEPVYEGRKLFMDSDDNDVFGTKKGKKILMNINPNDTTNTAFRNKESVFEGNEYKEFNKNNIKWD